MSLAFNQDLESVRQYYCQPRGSNGSAQSIYQIWERGEAFDDSVTPSTYCREYQQHMFLKLQGLSEAGECIFSIGCGNAVIESLLAGQGRHVHGVDCTEEAVKLARSKQVDAILGDFMQLTSRPLSDVSLVYADGLVGHLFRPGVGLRHFFDKLHDLGLRRGSYLVISNDAPPTRDEPFASHPSVENFWYVSPDYVASAAKQAGFDVRELYTFPYARPKSGLRNRTIAIARF